MNNKQRIMIEELRKNSRSALTYLAFKAGMPLSSAYNQLKDLEGSVIKKHTSLLDFRKLGFNIWTKLVIKVDKSQRVQLREFLISHKDVNSVFEIDSDYDFLAEVLHEDQQKLKLFVEDINERFRIMSMHKIVVVNDIQRERFLAKGGE